jgi:hypothetical protein
MDHDSSPAAWRPALAHSPKAKWGLPGRPVPADSTVRVRNVVTAPAASKTLRQGKVCRESIVETRPTLTGKVKGGGTHPDSDSSLRWRKSNNIAVFIGDGWSTAVASDWCRSL